MTARDPEFSFRFTHAITRAPAASIIRGLRAVDTGNPDLAVMTAHHAAYVATLRETGATVIELPALEDFPDPVFVEDTALCLPEGAVIMRPGAPSRLGEAAEMAPHLKALYNEVRVVDEGHVEGGDILVTGREILVGPCRRQPFADTPPGVLHFKTDCSLLDAETVLATDRLAASGCFACYRVVPVAAGEEAAANTIRFNDLVLMPEGFPRTRDTILEGYQVREIGNSECAKLDGGMSCLSLRFSPR
ncbi:MAG: dimethylarginine dimethylaminohydrolase [Exiguobacterium profundum]|nr:MAG: dimethylarginine dimethylaminohydrolase [Exiguobacterium profundum]